jgi:hypothetical protein
MNLRTSLYIIITSSILALAAPLSAHAGIVQTLDGRLEGNVTFADGRLDVGGKAAPWEALVYAMPHGRAGGAGSSGAVRLASGEVWQAEIVSVTAKRLAVRLALFGKKELDLAQVTALDFVPGLGRADGLQAGSLYREKGEPVPGALLWVDETRLALDSPLGVLTVPRDSVLRYVLAAPSAKAPEAGDDEIGLVDGSILRGHAKLTPGGLKLEHPVLGNVSIDGAMVWFVARRGKRIVDIAGLRPESVTAPGLLAAASPMATVGFCRTDDQGRNCGHCLTAITIQPKTVLRYKLDAVAPKGGQLVAMLAPMEGAKSPVHVKVVAGGKAILERDVAPGAEALAVKVDVPAGGTLDFDVDYGPQPLFPCGVRFEDPVLIAAEGA